MQITFKNILLTVILAGTMGLGWPAYSGDGFTRISTEDDFRKHVVGKKLMLDDNYFTINKNGTLKGKFGGKSLKGNWAWREGYWCRTLTTHTKNTDCQLWTVNENQHRVTRARGKGKGFTYLSR